MSEFLAATSQRPQRATAPVASPRSVRPNLSQRGWSARLTRSTTRSTRRFSLTNRSRRSGVVREEDCDAFLDMLRLPVGQACFARFARTDETWNRHSARSLLLCWLDVQELKTIPPNSDFRIHKGLDLIKKYVSKGAPMRVESLGDAERRAIEESLFPVEAGTVGERESVGGTDLGWQKVLRAFEPLEDAVVRTLTRDHYPRFKEHDEHAR